MSDPYANIRAAFREVTLGLMSWQDPPLMGRREYARLELLDARTWTPPPGDETEPYDVEADWNERGI